MALRFGAINVAIWGGEYYRLVTHLFVHGDVLHLLLSLIGLWWLGTRIEERFGATVTILTFVGSGIAGGAAAYVLESPATLSSGTSGALFGWAGVLLAQARNRYEIRQTVGALLIGVIAVSLFVPNISHAAHAGGFLAGLVFGAGDQRDGHRPHRPRAAPPPRRHRRPARRRCHRRRRRPDGHARSRLNERRQLEADRTPSTAMSSWSTGADLLTTAWAPAS